MLRSATTLTGAAALAGASLLFGPDPARRERLQLQEAYMVEVGLAFEAAAVRAALPEGLEPAPGFTGGLALQGGEAGWPLSPLTTGYVWIDITAPEGVPGHPDCYLLSSFVLEDAEALEPAAPRASPGSARPAQAPPDGLRAAYRLPSGLEILVEVRWTATGCGVPATGKGALLTAGPAGGLGVIHMPQIPPLCPAEVLSAHLAAAEGHMLKGLAPARVLWGAAARPFREDGP